MFKNRTIARRKRLQQVLGYRLLLDRCIERLLLASQTDGCIVLIQKGANRPYSKLDAASVLDSFYKCRWADNAEVLDDRSGSLQVAREPVGLRRITGSEGSSSAPRCDSSIVVVVAGAEVVEVGRASR